MRSAVALIELIFAIVIIAISVVTIPTMMSIADASSKTIVIDDDVMARLSGLMVDKFQARWGGEYNTVGGESNATYMLISYIDEEDLNCSRNPIGTVFYRINPDSSIRCDLTQIPRDIPEKPTNEGGTADGNVSKGLEMLNAGTETFSVTASTGETYDINATYNVRYMPETVVVNGDTANVTWKLGSSDQITNDVDGSRTNHSHLKRVFTRFSNNNLGIDTTLTFFKSNKGGN